MVNTRSRSARNDGKETELFAKVSLRSLLTPKKIVAGTSKPLGEQEANLEEELRLMKDHNEVLARKNKVFNAM